MTNIDIDNCKEYMCHVTGYHWSRYNIGLYLDDYHFNNDTRKSLNDKDIKFTEDKYIVTVEFEDIISSMRNWKINSILDE